MTDAERESLERYLRTLADRMALKDWAATILDDQSADGTHADILCVEGRKVGRVRFARDWAERSPEDLRHTCCHELLHCHHGALMVEMGRRLNKADFATFMMLLEYAIDGIADALAPHLPLMLAVINPNPEALPMGRQKPKPVPSTAKGKKQTPPPPKAKAKPQKKG
jgi:hypothetical protein